MSLWPVILCGGAGSRLWPASTPDRPKPFLRLIGKHSLFQETVLRLRGLADARPPVVVCGVHHVELARADLAELDLEARILAEPASRDTGPALTAATAWIAGQDGAAVIAALASDHWIDAPDRFAEAVGQAAQVAGGGHIVTFGARPNDPNPAYGYILPGSELGAGARRIDAFREKPAIAEAEALIRRGALWNTGNFVFAADVLMREAERLAPEMATACRAAVAGARREGDAVILGSAFAKAPRVAFDHAVMEKTGRAAVLPIDFGWSDLGDWEAVRRALGGEVDANIAEGAASLHGSKGCFVRSPVGPTVTVVGGRRLAVVVENGHVLVLDLDQAQSLKAAVPPAS